ncbi:hypothetical protein S3E15_04180 [Bacillus mycoides]|jgi:hypothetical protein|uniref:Uncharacterized protein n=1 Tax=Bacillus mycoides TaxID=1405 RepID=A0A1X6Q024_BACMY|nr:hypothetical protein M2E15_6180 [Bacillus mycoides]OSX94081.1 hypothetical protein S3E15_04180 [Bacillus mycoides]OSY15204.1 hypothetical protein BTJ48_03624 [Bacillus mycoides]VXB53626.1 conserved hypothetical protein [Bacillus mycoides]
MDIKEVRTSLSLISEYKKKFTASEMYDDYQNKKRFIYCLIDRPLY